MGKSTNTLIHFIIDRYEHVVEVLLNAKDARALNKQRENTAANQTSGIIRTPNRVTSVPMHARVGAGAGAEAGRTSAGSSNNYAGHTLGAAITAVTAAAFGSSSEKEYFEEFLDLLNTLCCFKEEGITIN